MSEDVGSRTLEIVLPRVIEKLREGKECKIIELARECNASEPTIRRIVKGLSKAGLVEYRRGTVSWKFEKLPDEYALEHSKQLVLDCIKTWESTEYEKLLENKYFLQHLETGYPDIYEVFKELNEISKDASGLYVEFTEKVKAEVEKLGWKVKSVKDEAKGREVYDRIGDLIFALFRDGKVFELYTATGIDIVRCSGYGYAISSDPSMISGIEKLIRELLVNIELEKMYSRLSELEKRESELKQRLKNEIKFLVDRVRHNRPLEGRCDLCRG